MDLHLDASIYSSVKVNWKNQLYLGRQNSNILVRSRLSGGFRKNLSIFLYLSSIMPNGNQHAQHYIEQFKILGIKDFFLLFSFYVNIFVKIREKFCVFLVVLYKHSLCEINILMK